MSLPPVRAFLLACLSASACDAERVVADAAAVATTPAVAPSTATNTGAVSTGVQAVSAPAADSPPAGTSLAVDAGAKLRRDGGVPAGSRADAGQADAAYAGEPDAAADPIVGTAPVGPADVVAGNIDALFAGHPRFSARFKQQYTVKVSGVERRSTGTVVVERPSKISFRYDPPSMNRIVSDGKTIKVFVADEQQMLVSPAQNTEYPGAMAFIMGNGLRTSFSFSFDERAAARFTAGPILVGTPRAPTPHYESVLFYVDEKLLASKDPGAILRVLLVDAQGNRNRFDFDKAAWPARVDAGEFEFEPPPGTDIRVR